MRYFVDVSASRLSSFELHDFSLNGRREFWLERWKFVEKLFAGAASWAPGSASTFGSCGQVLLGKLDAVFADDCKYRQKIRDAENFADALTEVNELEIAAGRFGGYVEPDDHADSHAVHVR